MEKINFTIPFGDTSNPEKIASEIAESYQFCDWVLKKIDDHFCIEGMASTKYVVMGWTSNWFDEN